MNDHVRTLACGTALVALAALTACGSSRTTARGRMAAMDHSAMHGTEHGAMPEMEHGSRDAMQHGGMHGMQHAASAAAPLVIAAPSSNAEIAQTEPAATLRADAFDAPAPAAIEEATKAAFGMTGPETAPPVQHDGPAPSPPPQPKHQHPHHHGGASS